VCVGIPNQKPKTSKELFFFFFFFLKKTSTGGGANVAVRPVSLVFGDLLLVDHGNGSSQNGRTRLNALGVPRRTLCTKVCCVHHHSLGAWPACDGASILHVEWVGPSE